MKDLENSNILAKWASGELSADEAETLEQKINLKDLNTVLADLDTWSMPAMDVGSKFDELKELQNSKSVKAQKSYRFRPVYFAAASIVLLIGLLFFYKFQNKTIEISTDYAEVTNHTLPCGSLVIIDAVSVISYKPNRWKRNRELVLNGQAYFEVEKGTPFIVHTPLGKVRVLGTRFNVSESETQLQVICYEGTVRVETNNIVDTVHKQEAIIINGEEVQKHSIDSQEPDWTKGFSRYKNAKLQKVVEDLKRYYQIQIDLPTKYSNLLYSGVVVHNDLETALELVFAPMGINYKLRRNNVVTFEN